MTLRFDIRAFEEVTSTNDIVKQAAADGVPEGLAVCAKVQTAGYGRRGNAWESGEGSLYLSLLLRPDAAEERASTLPLATAVAVRRAVAGLLPEESPARIQVKWPNDVVVCDGRLGVAEGSFAKLCGISTELKSGAVCVGIGVNVQAPDGMCQGTFTFDTRQAPCAESDHSLTHAPTHRNRPTYLSELVPAGACPSVDQVCDAVLAAFADVYDAWLADGFPALRQEYLQYFALAGAMVRVEEASVCVDGAFSGMGATLRGTVAGVTGDGRLLVDSCASPDGVPSLFEVASGSITMEA